jgi:glucosamine--fructose-6-phosphate aminotransferase (isomerizing)
MIMTNYTYPEYDHIAGKEATHTYPHWTLKEIHEQPEAVLRIRQQRFDLDVDNIILLGCGTSYYAGQYGMHFFKQSRRYTVQAFEGADFTEADIPKGKTAYIFISQSGETIDLYQCLKIARGITIGIINVEDSLLARELDHVMYCNAGKEVGVASVKSFTNQVVCLALLAGFEVDLAQLSADIQTTIDRAIPVCKKMASTPNLFLIGKGTDEVVVREGALKLKEISYIHAEGYSASSLKHGPFALLDEHMPVILLELTPASMSNCYHEIKSRKSPIFYITNRENDLADLVIPENKMFASLLGVIPLQLLAYYISVSKGINPDKPKNLAKVVTVL